MIERTRLMLVNRKVLLLLVMLVVAFGLRYVMNGVFQGWGASPGDSMGADAREFDELAQNLAAGKGYQMGGEITAFRAPGFPLFLAGVYRLFGVSYSVARIVFSLVGALTVLALYAVARHFMRESWALLCAGILTIYPHHAYYSIHFLSEPLFTLLLLLATWCLLYPPDRLHVGRNLLAGFLFGLAVLIRPLILLLMPMLGVWALFHYRRWWQVAVLSVCLIAVAEVITITPWSIRNHRVTGSFTTMTTNGGSTFWGSNNERVLTEPQLHGGWISTSELPGKTELVAPLPTELERDRKEWELGLIFLREHPGSIPQLLAHKLLRFWNPWLATPNKLLNLAVLFSYGLVLPIAGIGFWVTWHSLKQGQSSEWLLVFHVAATLMGALIFWGAARFRLPIEPLLIVYATLGIQQIWAWLRIPLMHTQCSPEATAVHGSRQSLW